ncbi:hypothetical protein HMPREF9554_01635, partial [Treponema phagedenis F0421]|uniref:hypothetical protein n=1 Tax=Treponema phagedenis TaxID=162 RepID=UPI0001F63EA6
SKPNLASFKALILQFTSPKSGAQGAAIPCACVSPAVGEKRACVKRFLKYTNVAQVWLHILL